MSAPPDTPKPPLSASGRRRALWLLLALVLLGAAAWGFYWATTLRHIESTDNAYVQGNVVQITPQVGGTVVAILADDTDVVKAGQPLVRLDPADAQVALDAAEAQLAQTVREVRTLRTQQRQLRRAVQAAAAEVERVPQPRWRAPRTTWRGARRWWPAAPSARRS